ncbi:hypothetical protein TNCV_4554801 [Trichonephila clavipes]|nr:hypothetical protein TNCV_4554801 [Trichonephila clavipes]
MSSETWLCNEELVEVENFKRITQFRRDFARKNTQCVNPNKSNLRDMCDEKCTLPNGKPLVVVTVYISVNQNVTDIIDYIHETLLVYTEGIEGGSNYTGKQYHAVPLIPGDDFNIISIKMKD